MSDLRKLVELAASAVVCADRLGHGAIEEVANEVFIVRAELFAWREPLLKQHLQDNQPFAGQALSAAAFQLLGALSNTVGARSEVVRLHAAVVKALTDLVRAEINLLHNETGVTA